MKTTKKAKKAKKSPKKVIKNPKIYGKVKKILNFRESEGRDCGDQKMMGWGYDQLHEPKTDHASIYHLKIPITCEVIDRVCVIPHPLLKLAIGGL